VIAEASGTVYRNPATNNAAVAVFYVIANCGTLYAHPI
jgi:hypothetical protein